MKSFALIIVMWVIALLTILVLSQHQPANGGVPLVKSSAAQGDTAAGKHAPVAMPAVPAKYPSHRH